MSTFVPPSRPVDYDAATTRLVRALISASVIPPEPTKLRQAILDYFENWDFDYAHILTQPVDDRVWYMITFGADVGESLLSRHDRNNVSPGQAEALGAVLTELDLARIYPDSAKYDGGVIEFSLAGRLVARIEPIRFQDVGQHNHQRATHAMHGIRAYGDQERLAHRLSSFPGLEGIVPGLEGIVPGSKPKGSVYHQTPGNFCVLMRQMLHERFGLKVKQSQAQELVAALFASKSWNHLVAHDEQPRVLRGPYTLAVLKDAESWTYEYTHYRNAADVLWAFAQAARCLPPADDVPVCGSAGVFGIYLYTYTPSDDWKTRGARPHRLSVYSMPIMYCDDDYLDLSKKYLANAGQFAMHLYTHFGLTDHTDTRIDASSRRMGIPAEDAIRLGDWLFSLDKLSGGTYLYAERFDVSGRRIFVNSVKCVDAVLGQNDDGTYRIEHQYSVNDSKAIQIEGLDAEQVSRLVHFSGLFIYPGVNLHVDGLSAGKRPAEGAV